MLMPNVLFATTETAARAAGAGMTWVDWLVVCTYICCVIGLGLWAGLRRKSTEGAGYFLADKSLLWPMIGLALFSTNISTTHLVSLAQAGYETGLAMGNFEWMAAFTLICLSLFFAPFYLRSKVTTLPDFLEKRYCRPCRDWLAAVSILSAVFVHLGFTLYTGAYVLEGFVLNDLVDNPEQYRLITLCVIAGIAGLYTIVGGLMAVVLTESLDTIVLLSGAICIMLFGYHAAGGWDGLQTAMTEIAAKASANLPKNVGNHLSIVRAHGDASDLPFYSVLLGYPILGLWYWCTDQTIVQRVLGAKDENHARVGPLFAGFIKILPVFIFVLPGIICLALIHQGRVGALPLDAAGKPDTGDVLATLIKGVLPTPLKGLMAAALLAALTSTVSGALNSIATLFSYDLLKRWRPQTTDRTLVTVGRIVTFLAMAAAIYWSLNLSEQYKSIFKGINQVISYIAPPIVAMFLWGVFFRRLTARAALVTAWFGTLLGVVAFLLDWFKLAKTWEDAIGFHTPWLLVPVYLFVACSIVLFLASKSIRLAQIVAVVGIALGGAAGWQISRMTPLSLEQWVTANAAWLPWVLVPGFLYCVSSVLLLPVTALVPNQPESPERDNLVWKSILDPLRGQAWRGIGNFRVLTVVLFVTMVALYWLFS